MIRARAFRAGMLAATMVALASCASHKAAKVEPAPQPAVASKGGAHGYRFNMTQHGKKMSAEDFDAWMKANGLHVAKGTDAKAKVGAKAGASAKTSAKAGAKTTASASASARTTAKVKPKTQAKAKPKTEKVAAAATGTPPSRD